MATLETIAVGYATGKTVKAKIIRQSDVFVYDWNDGTFKNSGWTTPLQTLAEDGATTGRYTTTVDPSTWTDGVYDVVLTETTITTAPIGLRSADVVAGGFAATGKGISRAVWYEDLTGPDQNSLGGNRAATKLLNLLRRFALHLGGKTTQTSTQQRVYKNDGVTVLSTAPVSDDGTTQILGPGA